MDRTYGRISKAIYLIDDNEHPYAGWEFEDVYKRQVTSCVAFPSIAAQKLR